MFTAITPSVVLLTSNNGKKALLRGESFFVLISRISTGIFFLNQGDVNW